MKQHRLLLWTMIACLGAYSPTKAQEKPNSKTAIDAVRKFFFDRRDKFSPEITSKDQDAVKKTFANYHIVNARFSIYPIARQLPPDMSASNLFAVDKDGKVLHLRDKKTLEKFFHDHHLAIKDENECKTILAAWLTLTQEFYQDGYFQFEVLEKEFTFRAAKSAHATGRAVVMKGGNGQITATLQFVDVRLASVQEKAEIRPGPRPECQATKLLDADPIVRRIAEADLLIMGLSARDYLMEQRERATPELRDAIDHLWRQIQKNGW